MKITVSRFDSLKIGTLETPGRIRRSVELASLTGFGFESEQGRRPHHVGR